MARVQHTGAVPVSTTAARGFTDDTILGRIRREFHEMPGLCLTVAQAGRLWNLDPDTSRAALHMLVEASFLAETEDGRFMLAHGSAAFPARGR